MIFAILLKTGRKEVLPYLLPASSATPFLVVEPPCVSLPRGGLTSRLAHVACSSITSFVSPRFAHSCVLCVVCCVLCVACCVLSVVLFCVALRCVALRCVVFCGVVLCCVVLCCAVLCCNTDRHRRHHKSLALRPFSYSHVLHCLGCRPVTARFPRWPCSGLACSSPTCTAASRQPHQQVNTRMSHPSCNPVANPSHTT